jgi:tetratricopeptide (TPR) repeat protein
VKLKTVASLTTKSAILHKAVFPAFVLLLVLSACSTRKNTFTRRVYHNMNAHYNAYWNGNESLKEGVSELYKNAKDNYAAILHVYNYGTATNAQGINPNMDRAIEKASKVIQRHSMVFDKKEHVRWVIYSYLMIGKANFYKQDYNAARRAFEYVNRQYSYDPIRYEARLWLAKTYNQQKQFDKSVVLLEELTAEGSKTLLPWLVRKELPLTYADMFIAQGKLSQAREQIEKAIPINNSAKLRTRLNYILAQIYQKEGKDSRASEYFTRVLKSPASFEMAFNARINLARVYDAGRSDRRLIVRELEKMLKDNKNKDFQDQIYYALADIALKEKNDTLAIRHLRKSVATSLSNDYQRTISSLKLADLSFSRKDYRMAQAYYDSALMSLPDDYPEVEKVETRTEILTRLVDNLQTIHIQDSLQRLAAMPEAERLAVIDKAIADFIKKEEEARKREEEARLAEMAGASLQTRQIVDPTRGTSALGGGGWYFYNPSAISMGYSEFVRKWGRRKLEDNWRLSNKREMQIDSFSSEDDETLAAADSTAAGGKGGKENADMKSRDTYLNNLPLTPEKMEVSNSTIAEAMYNAGIIYLEELYDKNKAAEILSALNTRYPENNHLLQSSYHQYRIHRDRGDEAQMNLHKDLIVSRFPDSDYAKILIDPDYNLELQAAQNRVKSLYEETFLAFDRGQYRMAIIYSNEALENYSDEELTPKFAYLRAVSLGKTESQDTMKVELRKIVNEYGSSQVADYARKILGETPATAQAGESKPGSGTEKEGGPAPDLSMYKFNPNATHFYAMVVDGSMVNVYGTKVRISDFNTKNYSIENLQVNSVLLDNNRQMITISSFTDLEKALRYYNGIKGDEYIFSGIREGAYEQFLISAENYPVFFKEKNTEVYMQFFGKNYLKNDTGKK